MASLVCIVLKLLVCIEDKNYVIYIHTLLCYHSNSLRWTMVINCGELKGLRTFIRCTKSRYHKICRNTPTIVTRETREDTPTHFAPAVKPCLPSEAPLARHWLACKITRPLGAGFQAEIQLESHQSVTEPSRRRPIAIERRVEARCGKKWSFLVELCGKSLSV